MFNQGGKFIWFTGVVENRVDPLFLNRVQVRAYGFHPKEFEKLPTADLPWASVVMPATDASQSGKGRTPHGLVEGSWVFGFFKDGDDAQDPVVLGSIAGQNPGPNDTATGFGDPTGRYPVETGDDLTDYTKESDVNKLARGLAAQSTLTRNAVLDAQFEDNKAFIKSPGGDYIPEFGRPDPLEDSPVYPFNKVNESESGHVIEIDDTPGRERILEQHRTGTHYEILPDGSKVTTIVGNNYHLVVGGENIIIRGTANVHIDGDCNMFVDRNYNLEVGGDFNVKVHGAYTQVLEQSGITTAKQSYIFSVEQDFSASANQNIAISAGQTLAASAGIDGSFTAGLSLGLGSLTVNLNADLLYNETALTKFQKIDTVHTSQIGVSYSMNAGASISMTSGASMSLSSGASMRISSGAIGSFTAGGLLRCSGSVIMLN